MVGHYAPLGFQKSLKPRNTLHTLYSFVVLRVRAELLVERPGWCEFAV